MVLYLSFQKEYKLLTISPLMGKSERVERYPSIFHNKELKWCYFNLSLLTQMFDPEKGYIHPKDGKYNSEELRKSKEIQQKNEEGFKDKFPIDNLIKKYEQEKYIKLFTGTKEKISIFPYSDKIGILIAANILTYSTQLNISVESSHLMIDMHNGAIPSIGLLMTAYGLRSLKIIYEAYNIDTSDLPILNFSKTGLNAIVPITHLDDIRSYDLAFEKINPTIKDKSIEFHVQYSRKDPETQSRIAFELLEKSSKQAKKNIYLIENN